MSFPVHTCHVLFLWEFNTSKNMSRIFLRLDVVTVVLLKVSVVGFYAVLLGM